MLAAERLASIRDALDKYESVSVAELSRIYAVSEETIRRDLDKLVQADGSIERVHGGAYKVKAFDREAPYRLRETLLVAEKQRIAEGSYAHIAPGDTIMLDSSTTALYLARILKQRALNATVITNSLSIADELCICPAIHLVLIGGNYRASSRSFVGYAATAALGGYYADHAFVSCSGVHTTQGLTDNHEGEAQVRRLMLQNAGITCLLVDSEKLGRRKTNHIGPLSGINHFFTDATLNEEWTAALEQNGIEMHQC